MSIVDRLLWHLRLQIHGVWLLHTRTAPASAVAPRESATGHGIELLCQVAGQCCYSDATGCRTTLFPGDVLIRHGCLRPEPDGSWRSVGEAPDAGAGSTPAGPAGSRAYLLSGSFSVAGNETHPLIASLPPTFVAKAENFRLVGAHAHPGLLADALLGEAEDYDDATVGRLFEALLIKSVQAYYETAGRGHPLLQAMQDPAIGNVIASIHRDPGYNWTLSRLAALAGLSRTRFCHRFVELTGMPAMRYLTVWRMHIARDQLCAGGNKVEKVAQSIGYRSPTAFHKAFKRVHGLTPAEACADS